MNISKKNIKHIYNNIHILQNGLYHYLLQAGYTALHLAASRGHLEVVRALLAVSRSVNNQDKIVRTFVILSG